MWITKNLPRIKDKRYNNSYFKLTKFRYRYISFGFNTYRYKYKEQYYINSSGRHDYLRTVRYYFICG